MLKKSFIMSCILFALLLFPGKIINAKVTILGSMGLSMVSPVGPFAESASRAVSGPGLSLAAAIKWDRLPFFLGIRGHFTAYDRKDIRWHTVFIPEFGDIDLKIVNRYRMAQALLFLRFPIATRSNASPYIDLLAGFNHLYSRSSIPVDCQDESSDGELIGKRNYQDTVFSYGLGGGVMFHFAGSGYRQRRGRMDHFLQIGLTLLAGQKAEYLTSGSIEVTDDQVTYWYYETIPAFVSLEIGYVLTIR